MSVILPEHTCLSDIQMMMMMMISRFFELNQSHWALTDPETSSYPERCCSVWNISLCPAKWSIRVTDREKTHSPNILYNQTTSSQKSKLYWQQKMKTAKNTETTIREVDIRFSSSNIFFCPHWFILNGSAMWQMKLEMYMQLIFTMISDIIRDGVWHINYPSINRFLFLDENLHLLNQNLHFIVRIPKNILHICFSENKLFKDVWTVLCVIMLC